MGIPVGLREALCCWHSLFCVPPHPPPSFGVRGFLALFCPGHRGLPVVCSVRVWVVGGEYVCTLVLSDLGLEVF